MSSLGTVKQGRTPAATNVPHTPGWGSCALAPKFSLKESKCTLVFPSQPCIASLTRSPGTAPRASGAARCGSGALHSTPLRTQAPHELRSEAVAPWGSPGASSSRNVTWTWFGSGFSEPHPHPRAPGDRGVPSSCCGTQGLRRAPLRVGRAPGTEPAPALQRRTEPRGVSKRFGFLPGKLTDPQGSYARTSRAAQQQARPSPRQQSTAEHSLAAGATRSPLPELPPAAPRSLSLLRSQEEQRLAPRRNRGAPAAL